jgi:hypothetical protein
LVTLRLSRAQLRAHLGYFEGLSGWFWKLLKDRKPLTDAGLEVVPRDGIEPPTRGCSVPFYLISATDYDTVISLETRTHQWFQPSFIFVHDVHGVLEIPRNYPRCTHKPCTHLAQA